MSRPIVTVGAGQAAAIAARTLRRQGFDGPIQLIGDEPHPPYQRPPLSKGFLAGTEDLADLPVLDADWCAASGVELRLGTRVTRLLPAERSVELADGSLVRAAAVLLATGVRPRPLPCPASGRAGYLRTIEDAQQIRNVLAPGRRLIIAGGGFIGAEVAAAARAAGAEVTILEMLEMPLQRALGQRMGEVCAAIHRDHGVRLHTGEQVAEVSDTAGQVLVRTGSGLTVAGDFLLTAIGTIPNTGLAAGAGLAVDGGIVTDECGRTSQPGVYAAGDVASARHPLAGRRIRVEHFDNASRQAAATARSMLGAGAPYREVPWFWSDQYEHNLQYAGFPSPGARLVIRGSVAERCFTAFYLAGGVLEAAFAVDRGEDIGWARELIAGRAAPDPAALQDEDTDLAELVPLG